MSLPPFPSRGSVPAARPFPPAAPGGPGSPPSPVLGASYDFLFPSGLRLMGFASRLRRFDLRAETGSPRFPGKPSRGFASFSDPGRSIAPCPCMRHSGTAPTARKMKAPTLRSTRLHSDASPPAVYASRRAVPHAMPHSLPAGGLTFAGRGSNPQACDERFQPTSWFPPLQGLAWRKPGRRGRCRAPPPSYGRNAHYCAPPAQIRTWTLIHPAPTSGA